MVTLKPVNNQNEKEGFLKSSDVFDTFIEKYIHLINNNGIINTILFNTLILSIVNLAKIHISFFLSLITGFLVLGDNHGDGHYYALFALFSYGFLFLDFSLISTLALRYYMGSYFLDFYEITLTQMSYTFYEVLSNKGFSLIIVVKSIVMFFGFFVYKTFAYEKPNTLKSISVFITKYEKPVTASFAIAAIISFYYMESNKIFTSNNVVSLIFFTILGGMSYKILKKLSKQGSTLPMSSLSSLIITSALPYPTIAAIPLHIKILTFPTIASYSPILKFLLLNTTYMLIQFSYSFKTNSLGLLSDSLHMLLDCISLFLGYLAERSNKTAFKQSEYNNSLSGNSLVVGGFTNGVLLLSIAFSVFIEGFSRIYKMIHINSLKTGGTRADRFKDNIELLIVSFMGLVVNLIGLFFFEDHSHDDTCNDHKKDEVSHGKSNDNMRGVWLHLLADTMGSVFVVLSTSLHIWCDNLLLDPIFSIGLSILILLTAVPLIKTCFGKLMLFNSVKLSMAKQNTAESHSHSHANSHSHSHSHTHAQTEDHTNVSKTKTEKESKDFKEMLGKFEKITGVKGYRQFRLWSSSPTEESNSHGHTHSHEISTQNNKTQGFVHILIDKKEDFGGKSYLKTKIDEIISNYDIELWVQIEDINETCWCRI
ncbi:hypothetical protein QEN19_001964 [Hanseniaspora menglaensis]